MKYPSYLFFCYLVLYYVKVKNYNNYIQSYLTFIILNILFTANNDDNNFNIACDRMAFDGKKF